MEHLTNRILSFIRDVPELTSVKHKEEIYNYIVWSLLRHIDYSIPINVEINRTLGYYTMLRVYEELCEKSNVEIVLGYVCYNREYFRVIENKLCLGDLYLFYLSNLDMSEEFHLIALELIEFAESLKQIRDTNSVTSSKVRCNTMTLVKKNSVMKTTSDKLVNRLKNSCTIGRKLKLIYRGICENVKGQNKWFIEKE
ncbi:hypothetical protein UT300012_22280 [Paraclostridium bifermentans]